MENEKLDEIKQLLENLNQSINSEASTVSYSEFEGIINPLVEEIKILTRKIKELSDRISELE